MSAGTIDVTAFIDSRGLSAFQIGIVVLCFLIVTIDGFDTAAIGFLAPAISQEWALTPARLAPLFGAGLAGLMLGAFICGPLADKFGRRRILLFCVVFFGLVNLVSGFSASLSQLLLLRLLTGLGLGGAMPITITLTSEYCPRSQRSFLVTTMFCGFTIGSAFGGLVSAQMVEESGWRSVLLLGGLMPLALWMALWWKLPESVRFLVMKSRAPDQVAGTLARIAPEQDFRNANFVVVNEVSRSSPIAHLFKPALIAGTLLLWVAFFMSLLVIYLLASWLPTLIKTTGLSLKTASIVTALFQIGGTVGAVAVGLLMDRFKPQYVLAIAYTCAALFIAMIGGVSADFRLVALAVFAAGGCISGGQTGANALTARFYPTDCRSTGVGWSNGIGRIGSIVGSTSGGLILSLNWSLASVFAVVAIPAVISGASYCLFGWIQDRHQGERAQAARPV